MKLKTIFALLSISLAAQSPLPHSASGLSQFWKLPVVVAGGNVFDMGEVSSDRMTILHVSLQNTGKAPLNLIQDRMRVASAYLMPPQGGTTIEAGEWKALEIAVDPKAHGEKGLRLAIQTDAGPILIIVKGHCEQSLRTSISPGTVQAVPIPVEFLSDPRCGKVVRWWFEGASPLVVTPVLTDSGRWLGTVALPAELPAAAAKSGCDRLYIETENGSIAFTTIPWAQ